MRACSLAAVAVTCGEFDRKVGDFVMSRSWAGWVSVVRPAVIISGFLLANTGCMVCRLDRPWTEHVWFESETRLGKIQNTRVVLHRSEDWRFSAMIAARGGKVMATRLIQLVHIDQATGRQFNSHAVWGNARDLGYLELPEGTRP